MLKLRDYQREAVDSIFDYWSENDGSPLVVMPTGCHEKGAQILMYDGSVKSVEDVVVGDLLMGPDSNPRRVLNICRGRDEMYRVTPKRYTDSFVVNAGHILSLKTTNEGKKKDKYPKSHVSAGLIDNVSVADYIRKTKNWKHLRKLWRTGVEFNNDYELPVPPYVIGAMLGDGSIHHGSPSLTNMDKEVIDSVNSYVESLGCRVRVTEKKDNRAKQYHYAYDGGWRNPFTDALRAAGVWGMSVENKSIPDAYKTANRSDRLEILAGLLDTDGHLSRGSFDFISKSKSLSDDLVFVARSLGFSAKSVPCEKYAQTGNGGTYYRVCLSGNLDQIPTRVERQKASPRMQKKNHLVSGFDIEPVGYDDFYGFTLDGDHLYLTADFVVHHNSGKALTIATFVKELLRDYPDMRILCVTHVKELIVQNAKELLGIWPQAPVGFYSASVGRKDSRAQVLFGGVQTIYNKIDHICGRRKDGTYERPIDLVLVDEAHLMPRKAETQYGQLVNGLRAVQPDMKLAGFTATPYRLGEGLLTEGDDAIFDDVCFDKPVSELIEDGYLCRPVSKGMDTGYNLDGVGKLGGDYKQKALQAAVDKTNINSAVCDEICEYGKDRKAWLLFCSGVEHALHMRDELRSRGISCETVTGSTPGPERDRILEDFKAGRIRAVTNNSVMTTGVNVPRIDLLALCRPTLSASLYIQMVGRGLRLYDGKKDCLVLDFAGNVKKHGPIDCVDPGKARSGTGEAPVKQCPQHEVDIDGKCGCGSLIHASARVCPDCGYKFPIVENSKLEAHAADTPLLSKGEPQTRRVTSRQFRHHPGKGGKRDSVKVVYRCGYTQINDWLCCEHDGYAKTKANRYWKDHGGQLPYPSEVMEWLERQSELNETDEIVVEPNGKYWNVKKWSAVRVDAAPEDGVGKNGLLV